MIYDAIIIGKGPAGISAALYTVRANMKTLVLGTQRSALVKAGSIENYFGFSQPISGKRLLEEGEIQLKRIGGEIREEEVVGIEKEEYFIVKTTKETYRAVSVLIATGQKTGDVKIQNLKKFEGRGISYCTTCDGFFYRGKKVGVLGFKDFALHEAKELLAFTNEITIFTNGREMELSEDSLPLKEKFVINKKPIRSFEGDEFFERIVFEDGTDIPLNGVFIAYDSASSVTFAIKLGVLVENQAIVVNRLQETNIEGLYAAGDCTGTFRQISVAVGQGAIAGRQMIEYVRKMKQE